MTAFCFTLGLMTCGLSTGALADLAGTMGYVNSAGGINLREEAGQDTNIINSLDLNTEVYIVSVDSLGWYRVNVNGQEGYVAGQFISSSPVSTSASGSGSESASSGTSSGSSASSTDVQALYEAYLAAEEAARHPSTEEEAYATQAAMIDAYNAYVAAANATSVSSSGSTSSGSSASSTDVQALYEAYLAAEEAARHPSTEEEAYATQAAMIDAYNAYVAAANSTGSSGSAKSSAASESDLEELYKIYEQAYDKANHPNTEEEAIQFAAEAQEAYNNYLRAVEAYDNAAANGTLYASSDGNTVNTVDDTSSSQVSGQSIAEFAVRYVGYPYVYGGSSLTGGADCSGFVMAVFAHFGISLPHNAAAQSGYGVPVDMDSLQPGDLLFYSNGGGIGHVTIYIGNGQVCHASNSKVGIVISSIDYRTPCCARRLV